jgi:hypothetical protein
LILNCIKGNALHYDEAYSILLAKDSFSGIWSVTARDVHPPLYYFGLKVFTFLFDFSPDSYYLYRIYSITGYWLCLLLCVFPIRRLFGKKVSFLVMILLMLIPVSVYIYANVRMYSWAMFFLLGTFAYAYDAYKNNSLSAWIKLSVFILCAMYTHYYALLCGFWIFILLLVFLLIKKTDKAEKRKYIINYLVSGLVVSVAYMPWLYNLLNQMKEVTDNYWITGPQLKEILFSLEFFFSPIGFTDQYGAFLKNIPVQLLLCSTLLLMVYTIYLAAKNYKTNKENINTGIICFVAIVLPLMSVFIYTASVKPIYSVRYLACYLTLFILGMSLFIASLPERKTSKYPVYTLFALLIIGFGLTVNALAQRNGKENAKAIDQAVEDFAKDCDYVFYSNEGAISDLNYLSAYHPEYTYYLVTSNDAKKTALPFWFISGDTVLLKPFTEIQKTDKIATEARFIYVTYQLDKDDPVLENYTVIDSLNVMNMYKMTPKTNKD